MQSIERRRTCEIEIQKCIDNQKNKPPSELLTKELNYPVGGPLKKFTVYEIPLKFLVFNKGNGRIASRVQTLENKGLKIDPYTQSGEEILDSLLFNSKPAKNKQTQADLLEKGQIEIGIITKDGLVIDGNRRSMLLKRNLREKDGIEIFKTVVLEDIYSDNTEEIENFETQYQIGQDEKVDYNPIDIYIKIRSMYNSYTFSTQQNDSHDEISDALGLGSSSKTAKFDPDKVDINARDKIFKKFEGYKTIKKANDVTFFLEVMSTMEQYLEDIGQPKNYMFLDDREEQFRGLTKWLSKYKGCESKSLFDGCKDIDIEDLRLSSYDYIRIKTKNETFRKIAGSTKENQIIGNEIAWKDFILGWRKIKEDYRVNTTINNDSDNYEEITKSIEQSEKKFDAALKEKLLENLDDAFEIVTNKKRAGQPAKLIKEASSKIKNINVNSPIFDTPEVQQSLEDLAQEIDEMRIKKSTSGALNSIINQLNKIYKDIENSNYSEDEIEEYMELAKQISSAAYRIQKI